MIIGPDGGHDRRVGSMHRMPWWVRLMKDGRRRRRGGVDDMVQDVVERMLVSAIGGMVLFHDI